MNVEGPNLSRMTLSAIRALEVEYAGRYSKVKHNDPKLAGDLIKRVGELSEKVQSIRTVGRLQPVIFNKEISRN